MHLAADTATFVEAGLLAAANLDDAAVDRGPGLYVGIDRIDGLETVDPEFVLIDSRLDRADRQAPYSTRIALHRLRNDIPFVEKQLDPFRLRGPEAERNRPVVVHLRGEFRPGGFPPSFGRKGIPCPLRMPHGILGLCPDAARRQRQTADDARYSSHTKVPVAPGARFNSAYRPLYCTDMERRDHESLATINTIFPSGVRKAALGATSACSVICAR